MEDLLGVLSEGGDVVRVGRCAGQLDARALDATFPVTFDRGVDGVAEVNELGIVRGGGVDDAVGRNTDGLELLLRLLG